MKALLAAGEWKKAAAKMRWKMISAKTLTGGSLETIYGGIEDVRDLSGFLSDCGG